LLVKYLDNVYVVKNPALSTILLEIRDRNTDRYRFRELLRLAGMILAYEASPLLDTQIHEVETPLGAKWSSEKINDENIVIISILRASLPFVDGMLTLFPRASIGFISAARVEDSMRRQNNRIVFKIESYYKKIPSVEKRTVLIVDPMLATGSTMDLALSIVEKANPRKVIVIALIASKPGVEFLSSKHPKTSIVVASIDPKLDERGFIVPGLGDAGDRCFG